MLDMKRDLYEIRINQFLARLKQFFYEQNLTMEAEYRKFKGFVPYEDRLNGKFRPITPGKKWGKDWDRAWFHLQGRIPKEWKGKSVCLLANLGGEALLFDKNGVPETGFSVHSIWGTDTFSRLRYTLSESVKGDEKLDFWLEASAGQLFGLPLNSDKGNQAPVKFGEYEAEIKEMSIAVFRKDIWELFLDCQTLNELMAKLPKRSVRRNRILTALTKAVDGFSGSPESTQTAREAVRPELAKPASASDLGTAAVGHAHLDTAWLWPLSETIRKCGRTFSSQVKLIEKYPDYIFGASQAQLYAFTKEYYPGLYKKIQKLVAKGRWEIQGGMWVEADCNLISGESMVRQVLIGKNFFKDEFGVDVTNCWLPDVFGYSAAMPQILKKSGIDYFVTQKLSWNQFNKMPFNTFVWRGIDGTEVIAHFPPEDNYNSELLPSRLFEARERFRENYILDEFLTLFGIGDGGGGPTEEIIGSGIRQKNLEDAPRVRFAPAKDFLKALDNKKNDLPLWSGELYFELHRGTLTTQAYNKKMNRFMEQKLRELEIIYAGLLYKDYPADQLGTMWKTVMLNQFHDIIPGSSITPVYEDCRKQYEELENSADKLQKAAANAAFVKNGNSTVLVNTLSVPYKRPVTLPENWRGYDVHDSEGKPVPLQVEGKDPVVLPKIPPLGIVTLKKGEKSRQKKNAKNKEKYVLENDRIRYEFSKEGVLKRAYDREAGFEVLSPGSGGNVLKMYEDRPVNWDAWDIDIYYEDQLVEQASLKKIERIADGPVRCGIELEYAVGNSTIRQKVFLSANSKRLDFETAVDWNENHKLLRTAFTVNVQSSTATFDIQYGSVKRNTHRNTSWDTAKFEVAAHKYADLSDRDYGAALLNDCKYGYKVLDNEISLSLLRAPTSPDPSADRGHHEFTYSFLPHRSELIGSDVINEAAQLNQPAACFTGYKANDTVYPVRMDSEAVIIEVIKKAEKEDALIIRMYEPYGKKASVKLNLGYDKYSVYAADLMENSGEKIPVKKAGITLSFNPFEIKTIKITGFKP